MSREPATTCPNRERAPITRNEYNSNTTIAFL